MVDRSGLCLGSDRVKSAEALPSPTNHGAWPIRQYAQSRDRPALLPIDALLIGQIVPDPCRRALENVTTGGADAVAAAGETPLAGELTWDHPNISNFRGDAP